MTVYIEYVIIENLVIDFFLLKTTFLLTGKKQKFFRLFLCALLGAVIALIYPLVEVSLLILTAIKIASGLLIVLLANEYKSVKSFYVNALVFFSLTFLTGGAIIGIYSIFNLDYQTEISVALMCLPAYLIIKAMTEVIKYVYRRKDIEKLIYKAILSKGENKVTAQGFLDTGNALYDGDRPVIVINKNLFFKLCGKNLIKCKIKKIKIKTVTGEKENLAFELDELLLYFSEKPNIYNNVTACIADGGFEDRYDIILHPALMESCYENETFIKTEKIS